jgi:hypothetical protein
LIARIAAQTGLAAQKAAQYAVELGRALRLMGPMRTDATGVVKAVEGIAARVEELGGNSEAIVRTYKQMLGGTAEAFMLRGRAGIGVRGLGTEAGANQALEGLAQSMRAIVRAGPGSEQYVAQLQAAAEVHQMAAEDVRDFLEAMSMTSRVMTESEALQKAYTRQTQMVGKAWDQMRESLLALYRRAMVPVLEAIAPIIQGLADAVKWIADTKTAWWVASGTLVLGLVAATRAMYNLSKAAFTFASTSNLGQLIPGVKGIGNLIGRLTVIGQVAKSFPAWTGVKSIGEMMGAGVGRMGVAAGIGGAAAGVIGAAGMGYMVGTVINNLMPQSWRDKIGSTLSKIAENTGIVAKLSSPSYVNLGRVRAADAMDTAARKLSEMVMAGNLNPNQALMYLRKNAHSMGINMRDLTAQGFQEGVVNRMKQFNREAAFVEAAKRTTVRTQEDIDRDRKLAANEAAIQATVETKEATQDLVRTNAKHLKLAEEQARLRAEEEHGAAYYFWRPDFDESGMRSYRQHGGWAPR